MLTLCLSARQLGVIAGFALGCIYRQQALSTGWQTLLAGVAHAR